MTFTPSYAQIDSPDPISPQDLATKHYIDLRTPSLPAPVTSGSGVQSFTDALGDVWVAANGVNAGAWKRARDALHSRTYRTAAINCNSGTLTPVPMDTVYRDVWGMSDGTGINFLTMGAFYIYGQLAFTATAAGQFIITRVYVGTPGAEQLIGSSQAYSQTTSGTISAGCGFTHVVTVPTSHVILQVTAGVSMTMAITASINWSYLSVSYLGTG